MKTNTYLCLIKFTVCSGPFEVFSIQRNASPNSFALCVCMFINSICAKRKIKTMASRYLTCVNFHEKIMQLQFH